MKPKISVIIPCYNVELYISQCIESLVNQTIGLENLELIFVNDASTDGTLDILLEYEKKYSENMMVINLTSNVKQGGARNIGMRYARAEYIGFVDSDDWVECNMYEILYRKVQEKAPDIVGCGMIRNYLDGTSTKILIDSAENFYVEKTIIEGGNEFPTLSGGVYTKLYKKSIILDNQIWFPEGLAYEDNYWGAIIALYVKTVIFVNEHLYHYRENPQSTTLKRNNIKHFDRLDIEIMKINKYKELGIFDKFYDKFEINFLHLYYVNTMHLLFTRFDKVPYFVFVEMKKNIERYFPDYRNDKFIRNQQNITTEFLRLIDLDVSEEELQLIADEYKKS